MTDRIAEQAADDYDVQASSGHTVAIMLATFNGERFVDEQIASIERQSHRSIDVHVSDDGSTDGTIAILERWRDRWRKGRFTVRRGPRAGFSENFRSLIIDPSINAPYFAFCDQDDIWEADKLERAVEWLAEDASKPRLFCSRTRIVSADGRPLGFSQDFRRAPSFRNALVQSIAGGNTMVLNRAARELLSAASARNRFVSHDWWTYLILTGAGGEVRFSQEPLVRYRQHPNNMMGSHNSLKARLSRLGRLGTGVFARWADINVAGLESNIHLLTPEARAVFERFRECRGGSIAQRLRSLRASGVYRQTVLGNLALYIASATGRL